MQTNLGFGYNPLQIEMISTNKADWEAPASKAKDWRGSILGGAPRSNGTKARSPLQGDHAFTTTWGNASPPPARKGTPMEKYSRSATLLSWPPRPTRFLLLSFILITALSLVPLCNIAQANAPTVAEAETQGVWYTVSPGDWLSRIAAQFGTTVAAIAQANHLHNPNLIYVGQRLWIPAGNVTATPTATPTTSQHGFWYTVHAGDWLSAIAIRFHTSVNAIVQANHIQNPNWIYVGQHLWIPGQNGATTPSPAPTSTPTGTVLPTATPTATPTPNPTPTSGGFWYTVSAGDWLSSIAARFGVTVAAIVQANHLSDPNHIVVGQRLWIPAGGGTAPNTPAAFDYGFNIDPWSGNLDEITQKVKDAGFHWVKFQMPWKDVERDGHGMFHWDRVDAIVNSLHGAGLKVVVSIAKAPAWARPDNADLSVDGPPADPQAFADFVAAFAKRYKGQVQAVELWNEPNLHSEWGNQPLSARQYVDLLCKGYAAVKANDPTMTVISAGLTPTGVNDGTIAVNDRIYLQRMYWYGARRCFDGLGAHPSGYNNPPDVRFGYTNADEPGFKNDPSFFFQETLLRYRRIMVANGDAGKKIWVTEFGWASSQHPLPGYAYAADVTLSEQAQYLVKAYQMMKAWGWVGPALTWNLNYNRTYPNSETAQFSVWGRPAYTALRDMAK